MKNKRKCAMINKKDKRSDCPITNTLDLIGDKWTLLIIRDMLFLNKKSFNEFLDSPENIATNILTQRLKRLEEYKIIEKTPYSKTPLRYNYALTQRGIELKEVLIKLVQWGNKHIEGTFKPPKKLMNKIK